jgi:hypothetical protein
MKKKLFLSATVLTMAATLLTGCTAAAPSAPKALSTHINGTTVVAKATKSLTLSMTPNITATPIFTPNAISGWKTYASPQDIAAEKTQQSLEAQKSNPIPSVATQHNHAY